MNVPDRIFINGEDDYRNGAWSRLRTHHEDIEFIRVNSSNTKAKTSLVEGEREERQLAGFQLIADERERQKTVEGWTPEHDDEHAGGELGVAGNCYRRIGNGSHGLFTADADQSKATEPDLWPWTKRWWKPRTRLRNLVRAGALYQAEIDRLCRARMQVTEEIDALIAVSGARK